MRSVSLFATCGDGCANPLGDLVFLLRARSLAKVCLVPITAENCAECVALRVDDAQSGLVATNTESLAEASTKSNLYPLAIYDHAALGYEKPTVPMVGFTMYELTAGVGFILRLMIDRAHQRQGYARAAMVEVIRRLKLHPEVQIIATSHRCDNVAAAGLYRSLGFVEWNIAWASDITDEVFLMLPECVLPNNTMSQSGVT